MPPMRMTRRQLLAASAASAALHACGGGSGGATPAASATSVASRTAQRSQSPNRPATPTPTATPVPRGGTARLESPRTFTFDTFDATRSGDLSTLEVLARTCSRLLQYEKPDFSEITGDLAASREQPDPQTFVLTLSEDARWQEAGPLDGRDVTADDIAAFIQRRSATAATIALPAAQRAQDWLGIESVEAVSSSTVRVRLAAPDPFFVDTLAGAFALVQAPEVYAVLDDSGEIAVEHAAGSGPFVFEGADDFGINFKAWTEGHRAPLLDGLVVSQPLDPVERFRAGQVHQVTVSDPRDSAALMQDPGSVADLFGRFSENPVISTMFVGAAPWNDLRLRSAIADAIDVRELLRRMVGGNGGGMFRVLGAPNSQLTFTERELVAIIGTPDEQRARAAAAWAQGGGPALGTITVDFPNVFDPRFASSSIVIDLLRERLGDQFRPAVEPYTTIADKIDSHAYGNGRPAFWFGWGPPFLDPQPARHLFETYSSRGPNFASTGFASAAVDSALDAMVTTFDASERATLAKVAMKAIAAEYGGGVLPWFSQILHVFRAPFLDRVLPGVWWDQHADAETTVDTAHENYQRPVPRP